MTLLAGSAEEAGLADEGTERRRFSIHGAPLELACGFAPLMPQIKFALGPFATGEAWPAGLVPTSGSIQPYDIQAIARHLSPTARRWAEGAAHDGDPLELYEEDERFWLVDERWGMTEINMLRGQWRSWLLPEPKIDPVRCVELAVVWPLAQLLRGRGLHLLPATSAVRDGWAVLILGACGLDPELLAMIEANYRLIGQRWTAIREEEGRLALLQLPGRVERSCGPRLAGPRGRQDFFRGDGGWVDLTGEHRGSRQTHAFCDAVLSIAPGRQPRGQVRDLSPSQALPVLRHGWPIVELHPTGRSPTLPGKLARYCRCAEAQLSRDPREMLTLLDKLHAASAVPMEMSGESERASEVEGEPAEPVTWGRSEAA